MNTPGRSRTLATTTRAGVVAALLLLTPNLMPWASAQAPANNTPHTEDPFSPVSSTGQPAPISADELITQATFLLMTDPQGTMNSLRRLGQNPALQDLFTHPANQQVLDRGNPDEIAQLPDYRQLQQDADVRSLFSQYRTDDPRLALLVATYWERSQLLRQYPEFMAVLEDPAIQTPLQSGNPLPLLMHPQGLALLRTLFGASLNPGQAPSQVPATPPTQGHAPLR